MAKAVWNGTVIAESGDTIVVDGWHYFPRDAVNDDYLRHSDTHTTCGWKGVASYFHVEVGGVLNPDAAFCYPTPSEAAVRVAGRVGFWRGVRIETGEEEPARRGLRERLFGARAGRVPRTAATTTGQATGDAVIEVDDAGFEAATEGGWSIVDFWAPWCGPCRAFHPLFEDFARSHAHTGLSFLRCDVDACPTTATAVGIFTIPSVVLFDPAGNETHRLTGAPSARSLEELARRASAPVRR